MNLMIMLVKRANNYVLKTYNDKVIPLVFIKYYRESVVISRKCNYLVKSSWSRSTLTVFVLSQR